MFCVVRLQRKNLVLVGTTAMVINWRNDSLDTRYGIFLRPRTCRCFAGPLIPVELFPWSNSSRFLPVHSFLPPDPTTGSAKRKTTKFPSDKCPMWLCRSPRFFFPCLKVWHNQYPEDVSANKSISGISHQN